MLIIIIKGIKKKKYFRNKQSKKKNVSHTNK